MSRLRILVLLIAADVLATCALPSLGQTSDGTPGKTHYFGQPAGTRRYRPGIWTMVGVEGVNPSDRPSELMTTMYFTDDPNVQYARQLWLPARSKRRSWCPILVPRDVRPGRDVAEVRSILFDRSGPTEVVLSRPDEIREYSRLLSIHRQQMVTGAICNIGDEVDDDDVAAELLVAVTRVDAELPRFFAILYDSFLPPVMEGLQSLDHLVLCSDRLAPDAAALTAVRRWLHAGGSLWVMLDQVDPVTVELLLGNAFRCHVVDRVGLTRLEIVDQSGVGEGSSVREFEEPVHLVRVLVEEVEVHHTVNGWPASFWKKVGKGQVLFTTLGPYGWMRPRTPSDPIPREVIDVPSFVAGEPLAQLRMRFFRPAEPPALEPDRFQPYLAEQIGYRIVGRGSVAGVLGGFCLVLVVAGVWLAFEGRLERMVWVAPSAAAGAALALIVMGIFARQAVPPTVAVAQLVEAEPEADDVHMTGLAAIYNQAESEAPLGAQRGGVVHLDLAGLGGTARRQVWTDLDAWHWENLTLPSGVRTATFRYGTKIDRPIEARAAFGPDGLSGTLAAPLEDLADGVIATPWGAHLAVPLDGRGAFTAGPDEVLAPGQFIAGGLLSDEQRRRQSVYQQIFSGGNRDDYPDRLLLLAWAKPLEMGFRFPPRARRVGSALLTVPLRIEPTPPGTRVTIPSPFLGFRSIRGPLGQISAAYSNHRCDWLELRHASTTCLRFQVPEQVLPLDVERSALVVEINAPSRKLELLGFDGEDRVPLASHGRPVGTLRFDLDRADVLQPDEEGGLLLGIDVGEDQGSPAADDRGGMGSSAWKIESVRLEITGQTLEPND